MTDIKQMTDEIQIHLHTSKIVHSKFNQISSCNNSGIVEVVVVIVAVVVVVVVVVVAAAAAAVAVAIAGAGEVVVVAVLVVVIESLAVEISYSMVVLVAAIQCRDYGNMSLNITWDVEIRTTKWSTQYLGGNYGYKKMLMT